MIFTEAVGGIKDYNFSWPKVLYSFQEVTNGLCNCYQKIGCRKYQSFCSFELIGDIWSNLFRTFTAKIQRLNVSIFFRWQISVNPCICWISGNSKTKACWKHLFLLHLNILKLLVCPTGFAFNGAECCLSPLPPQSYPTMWIAGQHCGVWRETLACNWAEHFLPQPPPPASSIGQKENSIVFSAPSQVYGAECCWVLT